MTTPSRNIRRQRGTGTIRAAGEGKWIVRAPVNGKQVSRTVHGSRRQAEAALRGLLTEVDGGHHRQRKMTVGDLLERWFDLVAPNRSPTTVDRYRTTIKCHLVPTFGATPLERLAAADIDKWTAHLRKTHAASTVRTYYTVLHTALEYAVKVDLLVRNPADKATPPTVRRRELDPPTWDEVARMVKVAEETDPTMAVMIFLAVATGMRRGELCGLRWRHLTGADINIWQAVIDLGEGRTLVKETKHRRYRTIGLAPEVAPVLATWRRQMEARATNAGVSLDERAFIFSNLPTGALPLSPAVVSDHFRHVRVKAGVPGHIRLHDCRHLHASFLFESGFDAVTIGGRLGHSGGTLALDLYGHFAKARDSAAAAVFGTVLPATSKDTPATDAKKSPPPRR